MSTENDQQQKQLQQQLLPDPDSRYFDEFKLYQTFSNFYMVGRDKSKTIWTVLKIDRSEPSELNIHEDSTTYTERECLDLLKRIEEGNRKTGGLKFVTTVYGIIGFVKFKGPYYMLLITQRRKIGVICGHDIYAIGKYEMIAIPNSSVHPNKAYCKNENRYKELLSTVDLTKDFFFSYTYKLMHSLQKNLSVNETGLLHYQSMFVWNEFLTHEFHKIFKKNIWTVALVYGFFQQVKLSESGKDFMLTLIARRSRYYAGTRFLTRGVNESGRVANDVETEQIVIGDAPRGSSLRISSVVQNRGSIPLFWSQETSHFNFRPNIILSKKDPNYDATRLHFHNLGARYGFPIIILNLIKTEEKKPRESNLGTEFRKVIKLINNDLPEERHLRFLHWDLSGNSKNQAVDVLKFLGKVADNALELTSIFCCQMTSNSRLEGVLSSFPVQNNDASTSYHVKAPLLQKGVLRTNCIDCLDRTNVAQYAYGLAALGRQLHALGLLQSSSIDLDDPLADDLMRIYVCMGDTLALQYGGSAAHDKIFCQRRGQCYAAIRGQEVLRTLQRYISNEYMDAKKQDAINVFLGYLQPREEQPTLWESGSDQHLNIGISGTNCYEESRSVYSGSIINKSDCHMGSSSRPLREREPGCSNGLLESMPEILTCESDLSHSRCTPSMPSRHLFGNDTSLEHSFYGDYTCTCSNFVDMVHLTSTGNSTGKDPCRRSIVGRASAVREAGNSKMKGTKSKRDSK